jgi:hypothetical protein
MVSNNVIWGPDNTCSQSPPPDYIMSDVKIYEFDTHWTCTNRWAGPDTMIDIRYGRHATRMPVPYSDMAPVTTTSSAQACSDVLAKVGAWPRDSMNTVTVNDVKNKTHTANINSLPVISSGPAAPADADNDGIPDFWETAMGLNPNDPADATKDFDGTGYTNIEKYVNDLALARMCEDYYYSVYPIPSSWPDYNPACCKQRPSAAEKSINRAVGYALSVGPNPFAAGVMHISLSNSGPISGKIRICNTVGQAVLDMPAAHKAVWNGNSGGGRVPVGVYMIRWVDGSRVFAQKKITVLK